MRPTTPVPVPNALPEFPYQALRQAGCSPAALVEAIVRAAAALLRAHAWGEDGDTLFGHKEWTNRGGER
ncbi:hypothetical protein OOK36_06795 [Streptomyces sp. NBC_00365]|uniref:hypothetical protein n=1 Tax=Streptomyces sp. NBC_00365 TaxID=2975726 RepID=UPI002250BD31|nr:hypothetical protein [Streptomyces sp. NBC_00365]MCX5088604.1 hypothetical protein [Streptomyces sp. NBC_00365]